MAKNMAVIMNKILDKIENECGFLTTHIHIINAFKNHKTALILSYILKKNKKSKKTKEDDWFIMKYEEIQNSVGCTIPAIKRSILELQDFGILESKRIGIPAMKHYKVDKELLVGILIENYKFNLGKTSGKAKKK